MSELFDDESADTAPPRRSSGRARALVITGVVLVVGFFVLTTFASIYTDRLWYQEVGYGQVFSTMLWTRVGLFLIFGLLMGAAVAVNMYFAYRFRPLFRMPGGDGSVDRYRDAVTPIRTWLLLGVAVVVGIFAGTSALGQWRTYLLWRNAVPFGEEDAYFGKDIGFYVFQLPWWHFVVDFVMAATVVALIATAVVHYLYGGIRLQVQHDRLSGAAQVQLSVLLGVFVLAKGVDYYLDRFDLVTNDNRLFTGMNYTGENALLPARNILMGVALICAILFFLNIWRRTWQLPSVGLALLALSAILLGMIWPAIVQNFQVNPSEADQEEAYLQANIDATRAAFDIDDVETSSIAGVPAEPTDGEDEPTPEDRRDQLGLQLTSVPVVDPKQVFDTFEQLQQPRAYYSVSPILDVDRYQLEGDQQVPLVLGVRELDQSGIDPDDQNWNNLHTVYTHGEGIIAAYANRTSGDDLAGRMEWAEGIQDADNIFSEQDIESRIYFGQQSPTYSVVGKASEDAEDVELGLDELDEAEGEDAEDVSDTTTTYDGAGGVSIGGSFRQLMYAVKFGEPNFVLSGRVHENSRVLYNRDPQSRVEMVAPWLTVDGDPYPAVVDGRVQWILDGYTSTDRYPNSQLESFESMIDDSLQEETGLQTIPTDEINYMRSAVKATVDAYDGTVTLYAWDEEDPILRTWMNAFPGTVKPKADIPPELEAHLRYPEDLFKVQRYQLSRYHVEEASDFYAGRDQWEVPRDPQASNSQQPPYRLFTSTGGEADVWSLTSVFVPRDRGNLAAFVSVNSDATSDNFGKIQIRETTDEGAPGPGVAANEMQQDDGVVDTLTPFRVQGATPPVFGNLLTVPVGEELVYVQPVYAVRSGAASSFPILQYIIVRYGSDVGIGRSTASALADALGLQAETEPPDGGEPPDEPGDNGQGGEENPGGGQGTLEQRIARELRLADQAFRAADQAFLSGDTVLYAQKTEEAREHFDRAVALLQQQQDQQGEQQNRPAE